MSVEGGSSCARNAIRSARLRDFACSMYTNAACRFSSVSRPAHAHPHQRLVNLEFVFQKRDFRLFTPQWLRMLSR